MSEFRVYYGDGSIFEGPLEDTPQWNVQVIIFADPELGRAILQAWDYYFYAEGRWYGVDGEVDYVEHTMTQPIERILKGRMIPNKPYLEVVRRAHNDPGFPAKTRKNLNIEQGRGHAGRA